MKEHLVLSVLAKDRSGLVESIAQRVREHEGNWLESRMTRLSGKFAGVIRVEIDSEKSARLQAELESMDSHEFQIEVDREGKEAAQNAGRSRIVNLDLVGHDQPGIVSRVSHALAERGANVETLETKQREAPMAGGTIFQIHARLGVATETDLRELQEALDEIAAELTVDIRLSEPELK